MRTILIYILLLSPLFLVGQTNKCDVDRRFKLGLEDSMYNQFLSRIIEHQVNQQIDSRSIFYFPVVIHVVAREPNQPVSVAQALNQLDVLNADFAGTGNNVTKLLQEFIPLVADAQMQFCLATSDPDGQPTSGITYTSTTISNIATKTEEGGRIAIHYDQTGGKTGWDPSRYINIWVGEYGGILGSASFPGMAPYPEEIGLILDPAFFGSIGDAGQSGYFSGGHTLTHEMGHFFGLKHIWGSGFDTHCDDDDEIDDTPKAAGPYYGCPSGQQISCGVSNMYQNFMDFTDDRCLAAFSHGQVALMQSVQEIFYPDLAVEGACTAYTTTFSAWYDQLVWSHDPSAATYVVYGPDGWMGFKDIQVYSSDGKIIIDDQWEAQLSYLIDLSNVSAGIYFVRISDGDKEFVRKVVSF